MPMDWKVIVLVVVGGVAALCSVMFRYEMVAVTPGGEGVNGYAYRLDRWTGEATMMSGAHGVRVEIRQ